MFPACAGMNRYGERAAGGTSQAALPGDRAACPYARALAENAGIQLVEGTEQRGRVWPITGLRTGAPLPPQDNESEPGYRRGVMCPHPLGDKPSQRR